MEVSIISVVFVAANLVDVGWGLTIYILLIDYSINSKIVNIGFAGLCPVLTNNGNK